MEIYSTFGNHKATIIERFKPSLKSMMWKRFTLKQNRIWYNILDELLNIYNERRHKGIENKTPREVFKRNIKINNKNKIVKKSYKKFNVGDRVRLTYKRSLLDIKGYLPNYTWELFTVSKVLDTKPITYKLEDYNGDEIKESFYNEELQLTN